MLTKVKILKDGVKGADDGATVREYPKDGGPDKDGTFFVSESLAAALIEAGEAEEIEVKKVSVTDRVKAKAKLPEPTPAPVVPANVATPAATPPGLPGLPKASGK